MPGPRVRFAVPVVMVVVAFVGGIGREIHRARAQRGAVAAILRAGGAVEFDWSLRGGILIRRDPDGNTREWTLHWPASLVATRSGHTGRAVFVDLAGCGSDAELTYVGRLGQLEGLNLGRSSVTDRGLANLKGLKRLRWLNLGGTRVTDAGLAQLRGLTGLRKLWLNDTQVSDAGLIHLAALKELSRLGNTGTRVTDAGMAELRRVLPGLPPDH